jgi:hypothetical protein
VRCPHLSDLPAPPKGLSGWPWTQESDSLEVAAFTEACPRITVVTPSFNQAAFLEAAIRSVLLQGYPDLEYVVLDGNSSDESAAIIQKYGKWLSHWESRPDGGQSDAINRGILSGSGHWATWVNSDDMLCCNALNNHVRAHHFDAAVIYVGVCQHINDEGDIVETHQGRVHSLEDLVRIREVWRSAGFIDQPAVLFPRDLFRSVGGLDTTNHRTMDYELWGKFLIAGSRFRYTDVLFGAFRMHPSQKTADMLEQTKSLVRTAASLAQTGSINPNVKEDILKDLDRYDADFRERHWRATGRLARLGLSPAVVNLLRNAKQAFLKPS